MKILITGGLGFIFSHVTEYFVKKGWEVMVVDNNSEGSHPEIVDGSFAVYELDVSEEGWETHALQFDPDYIVHAASISDVDESIKKPLEIIASNAGGTLRVFELARKLKNLKKLLYVSTDEVYGECEHKKREDEIIFPRNPYALSKAFGSLARLTYDNTYPELRDKTIEIRMCNIFGPRQDTRKILPNIKKSIETGGPLFIHNGGQGYREYMYVKNVPPLIDLLLEKGDRTYNITLNEGFTVNDLIQECLKIKDNEFEITEGTREGMDLKYQMDNSRIMELGWKPEYTFLDGLNEYL